MEGGFIDRFTPDIGVSYIERFINWKTFRKEIDDNSTAKSMIAKPAKFLRVHEENSDTT